MNFNIFNFLSIMGAVQGVIFSLVLIFFPKGRKSSNYLLSALIACIAITMGRHVLLDMHILQRHPLLESVPLTYLLMIGPLLYLYTKSVCAPSYIFDSNSIKHLLPSFIFLIARIFNMLDQFYFEVGIFEMLNDNEKPEVILGVISMSIYAFMTFRIINAEEEISDADVMNRIWMKKIIYGWAIGWVLFATLSFIDLMFYDFERPYSDYYVLFLYLAFVIYWLGLKGFYERVTHFTKESLVVEKEKISTIKSTNLQSEMETLQKVMKENKPYLNPELNLEKLSEEVGFSPKKVSVILNQGFEKSFYHFINTYRVEEFKNRISQSENQNLNLLTVAYDSGFNSKSTFNYIFKKETGVTPLQYKKKMNIKAVV
ncbi:helix-turn-helix domain-containing protein [Flammeovirga aprica]|uniref:Helix-turn-helix transcriptional regulator n=1 Tax=Flammeovirga aprica JL-4 TaxID=694437 RepID=A0A7X9S130_9BACT|nr:helix-turn-helix domain-containing protein [Flammeovirga aprica]NME72394.1 helix-turn-helix transcriptional regulator [Flammeovirga aprica JL-4]